MASGDTGAFYLLGLEGFTKASIDFINANMKFLLMDKDDVGAWCRAITGATNATPIVVTATAHGWSNGDWVLIGGVGGNTNANGLFKIANVTANTFELTHQLTGANIAGSGAYTSGGYALNMSVPQFIGDLAAAGIVARTSNLASKTAVAGVIDAADPTFSAVTGDVSEVIILAKDTGSDATSPLVAAWVSGTGLPVTPNGGDINLTLDNGTFKIGMI
jgi:hypothetical protein